MRKHTDLAGDLDEFTAIKRIAEIEIELIDSWLHQIDGLPESAVDQQELLELRFLCVLRNKLLTNVEADYAVLMGETPNRGSVSSGQVKSRMTGTG